MLRLRTASQATSKLSSRSPSAKRIAEARSIHQAAVLRQPPRDAGGSGGQSRGAGSTSSGRSNKSASIDASPLSSSSSAAAATSSSSSSSAAADAARAYTRSLYDPRQRSAHWLRAASSSGTSSGNQSSTSSASSSSGKASSSGSAKAKAKPSVKLSDKRSSSIEQYRVEESKPAAGASSAPKGEAAAGGSTSTSGATPAAGATGAASSSTSPGPSSMSSEDLLKQRLRQEQDRFERRTMPVGANEAVLISAGYGAASGQMGADSGSTSTSASAGGAGGGLGGSPPPSSTESGVVEGTFDPSSTDGQSDTHDTTPTAPSGNLDSRSVRPPRVENPFDSHRFVQRLLEGGFVPRMQKVMEAAGAEEGKAEGAASGSDDAESAQAGESGSGAEHEQLAEGELLEGEGAQLQTARRYDPAEAIMEAVRHLIVSRYERVIDLHMNKTQVENESYLFSAALSELRTELQVRARNDATALRSITTLLQREVDALDQKMREDINTLKHDIQVDMNNRKGESKEEQNSLEQEIQDLNNRFTISISDLKTEIEQNIKWDATRRALTLVFGIAIIAVATLVLAEYLGRDATEGSQSGTAASAGSAHHAGGNAKLGLPSVVGGGASQAGVGRPGAGGANGGRVMSDSTSYDAALLGDLGNVRPKSAEELGLVPKYEDAEAGRYV